MEKVPPSRSLNSILDAIRSSCSDPRGDFSLESNLQVNGVTDDSGSLVAGQIFFAIQGTRKDGHDFIEQAIERGALAIVGQLDSSQVSARLGGVPYFQVKDSRRALSFAAAAWYGNPSARLLMVGITGTSGKTTLTYLVESLLKTAGYKVAVLGTVAFRFGDTQIPASHTTPGPIKVQELLADALEAGCNACVMEVSSHALEQGRVASVGFDIGVFNNLSPEHLDFHPTMRDYFEAKALLFSENPVTSIKFGKSFCAVVNEEDPHGATLIEWINRDPKVSLYPFRAERHGFLISAQGVEGRIGAYSFSSPLVGGFNASNIAAAIEVGRALGISDSKVAEALSSLAGVPGRMEKVPDPEVTVLVDYAHKIDALKKVLETLVPLKGSHRLIVVFGCGGDRDRAKRPEMGRIASELADRVIVTSDNPRTEDPQAIISEILKGISDLEGKVTVEADRRAAIFQAVRESKRGDIVVIAGKGHEDYQIVGTEKRPFDDRLVASDALKSRAVEFKS